MDPPPTSTPLYTTSYASARAAARSPPLATSSGCGAVNGWWIASSLVQTYPLSPAFHSELHESGVSVHGVLGIFASSQGGALARLFSSSLNPK